MSLETRINLETAATYPHIMNSLERSTIAKNVSAFIIEQLLEDEPMNQFDLISVARDVAEDKLSDKADLNVVVRMSLDYLSKDPRVLVSREGTLNVLRYGLIQSSLFHFFPSDCLQS